MTYRIALVGGESTERQLHAAIAVSAQPLLLVVDGTVDAEVVVLAIEDSAGLARADEARRCAPAAQMVLLAPERQVAALRSQLPFVPHMASAWVASTEASPADLAAVMSKAASTSVQRRTVQAMRRKINQQVRAFSTTDQSYRAEEQRQRQLELSEHYLATLLAQAPQAFIAVTPEGTVAAWNTAAEVLFDIPLHSALGTPLRQLLPAATAQAILDLTQRVLELAVAASCELTIGEADGMRFIDASAAPVQSNAEVLTISVLLHEVTERRAAESRLRHSEARYRTLVETLPQLVWTSRPDGDCDYFSRQWVQYTGVRAAEQLGMKWLDRVIHPDDRERTRESWVGAVAGVHPYDMEYRIRAHDGSYRWFKTRATAITEDGQVTQWFGTCTDIEEIVAARETVRGDARKLEQRVQREIKRRTAAEQALHRAQKMEAIGNLTGGIAHDFNNILQVINGNLQLLDDDIAGNARAERRARNARAGVERGSKLAAQLLAFGRRQPLAPKVINVGRFVRDMDEMLRRTLGERIEVETVIAGGLWNTLVDPSNVESALLNLALNARDAMEGAGRLTIELGNAFLDADYAQMHGELEPGQYVMLAVTDTGCGMSAELADQVFEPFFSTKPEGKGTGLGLSMVYGFVKQTGGHVKIYSELGHGTTIKLYLPRSTQSEDVLVHTDDGPAVGGSETVLVVEDDDAVRDIVVATLRGLGYTVLKAKDAQAALSIIDSGLAIDLLFTDVVMPGPLSSPELARKARERLPTLAVLFTSGYTQNAIVHGGRLDQGVELLSKPYSREALARKFRHVLANAAQRAQQDLAVQGAPARAPRAATILVCEDDRDIRLMLCELLESHGHRVLPAADARQALALDDAEACDLLLTDIGLPDMSGVELALQLRQRRPGLPVIFASGQGDGPPDAMPQAVVIGKPFGAAALEQAVTVALDG